MGCSALGRNLATTLGSIGGYVVLLGGILTFVSAWLRAPTLFLAGPWFPFLATAILALLILFTSRPRLVWWQGRRLFNAFILVVLGALVWLLFGGSIVTTIGAIVTIIAGIILPIEGGLFSALGLRRPWYRRRWF